MNPLVSASIAIGMLVASADALASQRTFVASYGSDGNACSLGAPCRGFTAALSKTDPGGEVIVLDSAGYGVMTITQSVSITAPPGVYAGISVGSGNGVTINGASIDVVLRGLAINGQGGTQGIEFAGGATLTVERCTVSNFTSNGIRLDSGGAVTIADSAIVGNGGDGISVSNSSSTVQIEHTRIEANAALGVRIQNSAVVTMYESQVLRSGGGGVDVFLGGALNARLAIDRSVFADNAFTAVIADANAASAIAHIDIRRSTVARNGAGILALAGSGGVAMISALDNEVTDNTGNGIEASGAGATVRASGNKVMRNSVGLKETSGGFVFSPGPPATNYVRDNATDDGGHHGDTRL